MDNNKKLGRKVELEFSKHRAHVQEFWPNANELPERYDMFTEWGVTTDAGIMLVAYAWWDMKTNTWFIRRATSLNTVVWMD